MGPYMWNRMKEWPPQEAIPDDERFASKRIQKFAPVLTDAR